MSLPESLLLGVCLLLFGLAGWRLWRLRMSDAEESGDELDGLREAPADSWSERLMRWLGIPLDPLLFCSGLAVLALASYWAFERVFPGRPGLSAAASLGLIVLLSLHLGDFFGRRERRVESGILDAMDLMNSALAGGMTPRQALLAASEAADGPVAEELTEIVGRLDLGFPIEDAVSRLGNRHRGDSVRLFSQTMIAKWHSGGDFPQMLKGVSELVRDRTRLRLQVEGQLSGARYAALFSGLLPYLLIPLFLWRQPEWFEALSTHPQGPSLLLGAIFLQLIGFIWLRRVLRIAL